MPAKRHSGTDLKNLRQSKSAVKKTFRECNGRATGTTAQNTYTASWHSIHISLLEIPGDILSSLNFSVIMTRQ